MRLGRSDGALGSGAHGAAGLSPTSDRMSMAFSAFRCPLFIDPLLACSLPCFSRRLSPLPLRLRTKPAASPLRLTCSLPNAVSAAGRAAGMTCLKQQQLLLGVPVPLPSRALHSRPTPRRLCRTAAGDTEYHDALEDLGSFSSRASGEDNSHLNSPNGSHAHREDEQPVGLLDRITLWWEGLRAPTASAPQHGGSGAAGSDDTAATPLTAAATLTPRSPLSPQQVGAPSLHSTRPSAD